MTSPRLLQGWIGMGKDIRDPAGMNDEELFEAFGLLDLHQHKQDKTELHLKITSYLYPR